MTWMKKMRLSVVMFLASALIAGCSSDPDVDEPADVGQEDVLPDEDAGDAGAQDACLALPSCDEGFEEVASCEGLDSCDEVTLCGTTIFCAEAGSCTDVPVCAADEAEVESCNGYADEDCRAVDACDEQVLCVPQEATCDVDLAGCDDTFTKVESCEGVDGCIELSACGETYGCSPQIDICDALPVCEAAEVQVDSCDGQDECREVSMCGTTIYCASRAPGECDPASYTCPAGLEAVAPEDCTVDLGPDADRMCFIVELCPEVNAYCRGPVVDCTTNYDVCPEGYTPREDCNEAAGECGTTLICQDIGGCEAHAG
ncbi:hypothetical protein EA187_18875 [Lujinxingia sediminis]|uniref:Uncharacterized protein n=1 Tax=Lujinxingia sediminis TaxID=2480984 RepID=A0ABY0CPD2_9DELT|nr:hypothetical protein [Lujinxingia sediminis]RVU41409.1 hypothetical protein EA187_18875 [Lujinxingia sediminis]